MRHRWIHGVQNHVCKKCGTIAHSWKEIRWGTGPCIPKRKIGPRDLIVFISSSGKDQSVEIYNEGGIKIKVTGETINVEDMR